MPPEQGQGLFDVVDDRLGFGAHRILNYANQMSGGRDASMTQSVDGAKRQRREASAKPRN
jgi:hypothetical protein